MNDVSGAPLILWNPASLSYAAELLLVSALSLYFLHRFLTRPRGKPPDPHIVFLGMMMWCLTGAIFSSLMRAQVGGFFASYAMPWTAVGAPSVLLMPWSPAFGAGALYAFVQFAYRFPADLPGAEHERRLVGWVVLTLLLGECLIAFYTNWTILQGRVWFRNGVLTVWMGIAVSWSATVLLRQFIEAHRQADPSLNAMQAVRLFLHRKAPQGAAAARAYLLFLLLPLQHIVILVLQYNGALSDVPIDVFSCWGVLALLTVFSLIYFNYQAEHSSFMLKMVIVSMALILAIISGFGWVISPAYFDEFHPKAMVEVGQTVRFSPDGTGGYRVARTVRAPESSVGSPLEPDGAEISLPFQFPFYGVSYDKIYVSANGGIGFAREPDWVEAAIGYGRQPAIFPLAMHLDRAGSGEKGGRLLSWETPGGTVIRWDGLSAATTPGDHYSFELELHADGHIDVTYLALPQRPSYRLFHPEDSPWFVGITPGAPSRIRPINLAAELPIHSLPGAGLIQDYYLEFLHRLDRLYGPLAALMLAAVLIVAITLPLFFRINLLEPLGELLGGVRRFHEGDFAVQVPVTYHDEIGFLTNSFNAMASSLHGFVTTLEEQVAERVDEVSQAAARNALLEERSRLAADLHDDVSQILFSAALLADALPTQWKQNPQGGLETAEQIKLLNRRALEEIRLLMTDLNSHKLADQPLAPLLETLARDFAQAHDIETEIEISGEIIMPVGVQAMFYRIAQESLANIVRHAKASQLSLQFEALPGQALLRIADNGQGFDAGAVTPGHLGLQIMGYRARLAGGALDVQSRPGVGTEITLVWLPGARA